MSKTAREEFDNARVRQTTQNDARRIRQRVEAAQQSPARAGVRWPFELIQNAHDAGPRDSDERVKIDFVLYDDQFVVSHTGKPFVAQELSALLSGGSSKEFDSEETTGRFGTGFLVTHALSTRVDVEGTLITQEGPELFHIELMRDGDEKAIVKNIDQANESLEEAKPVSAVKINDQPTATFIYHNSDNDVALRGLERLEQTIPYLYATCGKLGRVRIERFGEEICFEPGNTYKIEKDAFIVTKTEVMISKSGDTASRIAVRIGNKDDQSALITVLGNCETGEYRVLLPSDGFPRMFVTFPITGTDLLPFNVVLDGSFAPLQERDGIAMHDADRTLIDEAMSAFSVLIQHAVESGWSDAHKLACLDVPTRPLSGDTENGELAWWKDVVLKTAETTAAKPIVQTQVGLLPALHSQNGQAVSFLAPAISADAPACIDYGMFHEIVAAITNINIPSKEVAQSWGEIARQWDSVGVQIERLGLKELTNRLKENCVSVNNLPIKGDQFAWLAQMFQLAADMKDQNVRDMVNGLLPDQNGKFRNKKAKELQRDSEIPEEIKDIAFEIGEDIRSQLLHNEMAKALAAPNYESANVLVDDLLGGKCTGSKAIDRILDRLSTDLPNDKSFDKDIGLPDALCASLRLAAYLAKNNDVMRSRNCPLLTAAGKVVRLSGRGQQILAPALNWPESEQSYTDLYPKTRLLADQYCDDDGLKGELDQLIMIDLVIVAPLFKGRRALIDDANLLREMSYGEQDTDGVIVRDESFGQIAFLATDLVQRCGQNAEMAKLLLRFVLNVAAREDQSWRENESITCNRSGDQVDLTLSGATWPFELKVRSWIPVKRFVEDNKVEIAPMPANESNLRDILDLSWLKDNRDAVDLLHRVFGFRQLTLMLDSLDAEIEGDLVELLQDPGLVKAATSNPDAVKFASELDATDITLDSVREFIQDTTEDEELVEYLAKRREQRLRGQENQKLGKCVEILVKESLEEVGFTVVPTGIGSDFEIAAEVGDVANLKLTLDSQSWLVEVKSTRDQRVRMTDTQAKKAVKEGSRFLLCVVPVEPGSSNPELDDVRANMQFVAGIGARMETLCDDLGIFEEMHSDITADNSAGVQLEITPGPARVSVAGFVWENDGFPLKKLADHLTPETVS